MARELVNYDSWVFQLGVKRIFRPRLTGCCEGVFSFFGIFGTSNGDLGAYLPTMLSTWERHIHVAMFTAAVAIVVALMIW